MDFTTEEELCQQAYEVWLHYACPTCDRPAPQIRLAHSLPPSSSCDGPCSVLTFPFASAFDQHPR